MKDANSPFQRTTRNPTAAARMACPRRTFGPWSVFRLASLAAVAGLGVSMMRPANGASPGQAAPRQGAFDLRVNDVSGVDAPWPMIGGLPFPEGAIHDAAQIRIVDGQGREVPAQIDVAATWRDGSIRWAQAGINASPQGEYRVEYGPQVARGEFDRPLQVREDGDGAITVDTGEAVYEFLPDRLLPERGVMGEVVVLEGSGDGAYLIDNRGRLARVAGETAGIETEILKEGPGRTVIRREGWYVTEEDTEQVAQARMWFYFTAGSPFVRMTHSIVFTEDTNELWLRDYGLAFRTPAAPDTAVFAISEPAPGEDQLPGGTRGLTEEAITDLARLYFAELPERDQRFHTVPLNGEAVYMLQDRYPHLLGRDYLAVIAQAPSADAFPGSGGGRRFGNLWEHVWLEQMDVAGDWGEARYGDHALMVVMPQLAQRFPKEIAFGPTGARVAFWSGRSGRELDFRSVTLVNEYWREWATSGAWKPFRGQTGKDREMRGPRGADLVAATPSNAQGAARTHDVWLLPRTDEADASRLRQRALAASHPPLLLADPAWLGPSEAIGWPIHPVDVEQFEREEEILRGMSRSLFSGAGYNAGLRRTGFISWGQNANLHGPFSWFRISRMADYNLRRNIWNLYARSGERSYYDYGARFNQFAGDWEIAHWTAGNKFKGEFAGGSNNDLPLHWSGPSNLRGSGHDITGHNAINWLLEYYLTGNEYPGEVAAMLAQAYRARGETEMQSVFTSHIYVLSVLYAHERDETLKRLLERQVELLIDLDNPTGLDDRQVNHGVYYKTHRSLLALYDYYHATGDERARQAFLKGVEDKFNYHLVFDRTDLPGSRGAFGRSYSAFLFSIAYQWTGRHAYLQVLNRLHDEFLDWGGGIGLLGQMAPFMGVPTALVVLAEAAEPIGPFPVLETDQAAPLRFGKREGEPMEMRLYVRTSEAVDENTPPVVAVRRHQPQPNGPVVNAEIEVRQMVMTQNAPRHDPRRWHLFLTLPAEAEAGEYLVELPNASTITVLESDADAIRLHQ